MLPYNGKDSVFSSNKPKKNVTLIIPTIIGMITVLVIFYNSFSEFLVSNRKQHLSFSESQLFHLVIQIVLS